MGCLLMSLRLKKDCPVILLRNLDPHNSLCNGTRLVIRGFQNNTIDAEIVNGDHARTRVFIPRIPMSPLQRPYIAIQVQAKAVPNKIKFCNDNK